MSLPQLLDVLDSASRELGATTRAGYFDIARDAASAVARGDMVDAEICLSPGTAHLANKLQKQLGDKVRVLQDCGQARLSDQFLLPATLIALADPAEVRDSETLPVNMRWVAGQGDGRRCAIFLSMRAEEFEGDAALQSQLQSLAPVSILPAAEDDIGTAIQGFIDDAKAENAKAAADLSSGRIARYAHEIISDEMRALELRKQLLTDDLASARRPGAVGSTDSNNRIRTLIQKNLSDAERAFKLKYDELNRNKSGEFQMLTNGTAAQLGEGQMVHINLASKTETTETEISQEYLDDFVGNMKRAFKSKAKADVEYLEQVKKLTLDQINGILQSDGLRKIDPENIYAQDPDANLPAESHFHIQRKYSGEITKDGLMQYFIALRDYTGMIMVLVGILAPLTLIAASQDAEPGSFLGFINQISAGMKQVRTVLTFITAILVAVMLIYGFFDLRRRIPQKRIEERERDVQKAREAMEQEGRRMFNDASRDWVTQLGTYVRDLTTSINAEIEQAIRTKTIQAGEEQEEKRRKVAMAQASVDARLKSVAQLERRIEPLLRR